MGSSAAGFWAWRPAREFPVKRWLRERYPFGVSFAPFRVMEARPAGWATATPREFPAMVWVEGWRAPAAAGG